MITPKQYKDSRTGEIVTQVPLSEIEFFEEVVTTNGDTVSERQAKREAVAEALDSPDCTLNDIEEITEDGDPFDYL